MFAYLVMALSLMLPISKASARTDVSVDLRIGDPYRGPSLVFRSQPDVVVVPDTRVYYVRDYDYDLYRYGGYWYYNYDGGWYRARRYNGPFVYIGYRSVPREVAYVPVRYRRHWHAYNEGPHGHAYGHYKAREERRDVREERRDVREERRDRRDRGGHDNGRHGNH
jgi:hypothetical protein